MKSTTARHQTHMTFSLTDPFTPLIQSIVVTEAKPTNKKPEQAD